MAGWVGQAPSSQLGRFQLSWGPGWDGLASGDGLLADGWHSEESKAQGLWEWPAGAFLVGGPDARS